MRQEEIQFLRDEVHDLRAEVKALKEDVSSLVEVWRTAGGVLKAIKVLGAIGTAFAGVAAALAVLFHFTPRGH